MRQNPIDSDFSCILKGRDSLEEVLLRYLDSQLALERANNIAQVLQYDDENKAEIVLDLLRNTKIKNVTKVTNDLIHAWNKATIDM